jgi:hypothetical protein
VVATVVQVSAPQAKNPLAADSKKSVFAGDRFPDKHTYRADLQPAVQRPNFAYLGR